MTTPTTIVRGFDVGRTAMVLAGGAAVVNAGVVLAGWGQEPKSSSEKVGTAIAHGAIVGTATAVTKRPFARTVLLGALAGDVAGNLASAVIRGNDKDAPVPRPGNAWTDVTDAIGRDALSAAKRNAIALGAVGAVVGGLAGFGMSKSVKGALQGVVYVGGAGAGIGAASGALDGAWRGLYQGTGIALGRAVEAARSGA